MAMMMMLMKKVTNANKVDDDGINVKFDDVGNNVKFNADGNNM